MFVLNKLQPQHINQILQNAIVKYNTLNQGETGRLIVDEQALDVLSQTADGDARTALNILDGI